jgi:hypothetical protein
MKTPDRMGCHPSAVTGGTVGMKVGEGLGAGGTAVGNGVLVGSGVRVDSAGAGTVGSGEEAALVVASQADNAAATAHRHAQSINQRLTFIRRP